MDGNSGDDGETSLVVWNEKSGKKNDQVDVDGMKREVESKD